MAHAEFNENIRTHGSTDRHPMSRTLPRNRPVRRRMMRTSAPAFDPSLVSKSLSPRF